MSSSFNEIQISKLPYSQRQLIVVQPNEIVRATRASKMVPELETGSDWSRRVIAAADSLLGGPLGLAGNAAVLLAREAYEAWARARESGVDILQISNVEARQLSLPPGHPRQGVLYVAHPAMSSVYYATASFHRMVFEHKFAEALQLLMSLGASHIKVTHVHGWSHEFSAKMSASIPQGGIESSASTTANHSSSILFEADLENRVVPSLPKDLVWYPHEPTWQNVAAGRLNYGMRNFSLVVNYQDDLGVNVGLKLKAEKAGLEMGGSFQSHVETSWQISGVFDDSRAAGSNNSRKESKLHNA